jgi:DNA-binding transcriptional regulator YiaG
MKFEKMTPAQLKKSREKLGMSQESLARHLDVSARTVYRWEKGENQIHSIFARQIRELEKREGAA